jgi:hypothetical protein
MGKKGMNIRNNDIRIGLNDSIHEGGFEWVADEAVTYSARSNGQSDNSRRERINSSCYP